MKNRYRIPAGVPKFSKGFPKLDFIVTKKGYMQYRKEGSVDAKEVRFETWNYGRGIKPITKKVRFR